MLIIIEVTKMRSTCLYNTLLWKCTKGNPRLLDQVLSNTK